MKEHENIESVAYRRASKFIDSFLIRSSCGLLWIEDPS